VSFEFAAPNRILFGDGRVREAGAIAAELGTRALVVQGSGARGDLVAALLCESGITTTTFPVSGEPTIGLVERGVQQARRVGCDVVVAVGGGSVLDTGKAIAALLTNPGDVRGYLEVIGEGRPLTCRAAPLLAIPTTAGTGSEVTRNAVLLAEQERVKVSLRSPLMIPTVALVDPELTHTLPPDVTASTGLDALTQCIEPFVSPQANPLTDALATEGIGLAAGALERAVTAPGDREARRDMAVASLCGGLALANAKLGAVHGFAAAIGGLFPVPHGIICARLLPAVVRANVGALRSGDPASPALARYTRIAELLTGRAGATAEDAAEWIERLTGSLNVPRLASFGIAESDVSTIVPLARRASSMGGNPVVLTDDELSTALRAAL
jgi:alcohol dehydrogenase class IV